MITTALACASLHGIVNPDHVSIYICDYLAQPLAFCRMLQAEYLSGPMSA